MQPSLSTRRRLVWACVFLLIIVSSKQIMTLSSTGAACACRGAAWQRRASQLLQSKTLTMTLEADADQVIRCPTVGCSRYWRPTRPLPSELKFPMLRTTEGRFKCPGCAYHAYSSNQVYSHYIYHSNRAEAQHPGKVCAATPKNLLSPQQQEDLRRHRQVCNQRQPAKVWKKRYVCCRAQIFLVAAEETLHSLQASFLAATRSRAPHQSAWHCIRSQSRSKCRL